MFLSVCACVCMYVRVGMRVGLLVWVCMCVSAMTLVTRNLLRVNFLLIGRRRFSENHLFHQISFETATDVASTKSLGRFLGSLRKRSNRIIPTKLIR